MRHTARDLQHLAGTIDWDKVDATTEEDIERQAIEDGDTADVDPSKVRRYRTPASVLHLREGMNVSQAEFATRFGLRLDTVRTWEESGADIEDPAALALLQVIEREPAVVARVFAKRDVA